jgi:LmbE family N-acetylglucosaminyl deacetylase
MLRRDLLTGLAAWGVASLRSAAQTGGSVVFEGAASGKPHAGKVLAAIQPHSDDVPLLAAGTVAKLIQEGYTGYLIRATNDDMGDDVGERGSLGENVLRNEKENAEVARVLGLERAFDLNYLNHRLSGIQQLELQLRLIFLIRLLRIDTVFCYDPWAHDEENPDHYVLGHCVEAACWMAGREHDYPEHFAAGLKTHAVSEKYYYARHPEITRVVDISGFVDKKVDANRANRAKGPGGRHGSRLKADLAARNLKLPLLGNDDDTADREYIKEFVLARDRDLGRKYGVAYAEAFHYIGPAKSRLQEYIRQNAVPLK